VEATSANVHDVTKTSKLLTGEEEVVYGDSGYLGAGKHDDAIIRNKAGRKIKYRINRRPSQVKKLSKSGQYAAKKAEHAKSSVRAKVEHVFGVVKKQLRFRKTRYRGLEKQRAKFNIMFALANLILTDRPCLAAGIRFVRANRIWNLTLCCARPRYLRPEPDCGNPHSRNPKKRGCRLSPGKPFLRICTCIEISSVLY